MFNTHIRFDRENLVLHLLDQRFLPGREEWFTCSNLEEVIFALKVMVVRGAPAIGVTAGFGAVLALKDVISASPVANWGALLEQKLGLLAKARPTAVNLRWGVERMRQAWQMAYDTRTPQGLLPKWLAEAARMQAEDEETNRRMGRHGARLIDEGDTILTHCNAGALATAGYGTALGVIYAAHEAGKNIKVIADETRPFLQGARLTAYELQKSGVPVTVACDNACALLMQKGLVQKVVVGADRIAANGDTANKIGTFGVALLAKEFGVPFYVAAPLSTIDLKTPDGSAIPIEERPEREVTHVGDQGITPEGVPVYNFAFDVTPSRLISGIITEVGTLTAPYKESLKKAIQEA